VARPNRFIEFVKRHETKSYGTSVDQPLLDTRLDTPLAAAGRATEDYFVPNALEPTEDEAVVMAVLPSRAGMMTSYDPKMGLVAGMDKTREKMFDLKCYILSRPTTIHLNIQRLSALDPMYVSLLPTFKTTTLEGAPEPVVGDIIIVKYDNLTHTSGDFVKTTGINISDMFEENVGGPSLRDRFSSSAKKTMIGGGVSTPDRLAQEAGYLNAAEQNQALQAGRARGAPYSPTEWNSRPLPPPVPGVPTAAQGAGLVIGTVGDEPGYSRSGGEVWVEGVGWLPA